MPNSGYKHLGMPFYTPGFHWALVKSRCTQTLAVSKVSSTSRHSSLAFCCFPYTHIPPSNKTRKQHLQRWTPKRQFWDNPWTMGLCLDHVFVDGFKEAWKDALENMRRKWSQILVAIVFLYKQWSLLLVFPTQQNTNWASFTWLLSNIFVPSLLVFLSRSNVFKNTNMNQMRRQPESTYRD